MEAGWLDAPLSLGDKRIYVAGHRGLVGSAIMRRLDGHCKEILTSEIDLREQAGVRRFFEEHRPDIVILAAAKVGGIGVNATQPADFIADNLLIQTHVIDAAYRAGVQKLLFLGSSCIYPKMATQPISEDALLSGPLEPTNSAYAVAKIAGIEMCQAYRAQYGADFISVMPCNLYGPGDRFDEAASHVIPALMLKAHEAKLRGDDILTIWGSGAPLREFLYVDDLADACVFALERYSSKRILNIGSGDEISIADLAHEISAVVGFEGSLEFDTARPDGTPRKILDSSYIQNAGWQKHMDLRSGLEHTYSWFLTWFTAHKIDKKRQSAL